MTFIEGLIAGYGIAIPVGAVAVLIIDAGLRGGFWRGFWAGAGAASADFTFALLAALAGQLIAAQVAPFAGSVRLLSALALLAMGAAGLVRALRPLQAAASAAPVASAWWRVYLQFLGITLLNPLTVAYFASLILGGAGSRLVTLADRALFVAGAALASLSWQTLLAGIGGLGHRRFSPQAQRWLSVAGSLIVIGLGVRLLLP